MKGLYGLSILLVTLAFIQALSCQVAKKKQASATKVITPQRASIPPTPYPQLSSIDEPSMLNNMKYRRDKAWEIFTYIIQPIRIDSPHLTESTNIPLWQTWFSAQEFEDIFTELYVYDEEYKQLRESSSELPLFTEEMVENAIDTYTKAVESGYIRWSKEEIEEYYDRYKEAKQMTSMGVHEFLGHTRKGLVTYSPGLITHLVRDSIDIYKNCLQSDTKGIMQETHPTQEIMEGDDITCYTTPFPGSSAVIKTTWAKVSDGITPYETSAASLAKTLGIADDKSKSGLHVESDLPAQTPSEDEIYTIHLPNDLGHTITYGMTGMHIMTKELKHWTWISLWWSPNPDEDFGADRPSNISGPWRNYKMCTIADYLELDPDPASHYKGNPQLASLATSLSTIKSALGTDSWCSNPYVELGKGNAVTNCIGCHQHAGLSFRQADLFSGKCDKNIDGKSICDLYPRMGRARVRNNFPGDYLISSLHQDALWQAFANIIEEQR